MELELLKVKEAQGEQISNPHTVLQMMADEARADRECFWVLHLSTKNHVISKELVAMGALDQCLIHPREVFRKAVVCSTCSIITVHNHPSGSPEPSPEDYRIWERLEAAGGILGIDVLDHLIITPSTSYYSHKESKKSKP